MKSFLFISILILTATRSFACDLCGCTLCPMPLRTTPGFFLGASEQFTRYDTLQIDGHAIDNDARQRLDSSITQLYAGYRFNDWLSVQFNAPLIDRAYRRTTETGLEKGNVSGLGDTSLLATVVPIRQQSGDFTFIARLTAGVKFPTGDSARLGEEAEEGHTHEEAAPPAEEEDADHPEGEEHAHAHAAAAPNQPESGIHGHDLALGSGSVDAIVGGSIHAQWQRAFFAGEVQYAIRTEGDFDYRYANDLTWSAGPGVGLIVKDTHRVTMQFVCSGESKGKDKFRGVKAGDTAVTTVFLGPKISLLWRDRFNADVELAVPILRDNTELQIVPDYRFRAAVGWRF